MMLPRRQHRYADQREPGVEQHASDPAELRANSAQRMTSSATCSDGAWLKGLSKTREHAEQPAERSVGLGAIEGESERKEQEERHRDELRGQQAPGVRVELAAVGAGEQRQSVEEIDRPVRNDRPRHERDRALPVEDDRADLRDARRSPRSRNRRSRRRTAPETRARRKRGPTAVRADGAAATACVHDARRSASDTVKMPSSLMRCRSLRKPAARPAGPSRPACAGASPTLRRRDGW